MQVQGTRDSRRGVRALGAALFVSLLFGSLPSLGQGVGAVPQLLKDAGFPEVVVVDGGTGNINAAFNMCMPMGLNGVKNGPVTNLKMTLNTKNFAANFLVNSALGNLSVNVADIRANSVKGNWSANLNNMGTQVLANGKLSNVGPGGGDVVVESITGTGITLKFINIHLDVFPDGAGMPCSDVVIFINATLRIDFAQGNNGEAPPEVQGGSEVTQVQALGNFANNVGGLIPVRVGTALGGPMETTQLNVKPVAQGMMLNSDAAGDGFEYPFGLWASYQRSDFADEFASTQFDSNSNTLFVGADFSPWDGFLGGVAFGYEKVDTDTTFNGGQQESSSYSVVPYLGLLLSDHVDVPFDLTFDMALGYSVVDIDQFRVTGGTRVTSTTDSERWFLASNVAASQTYGSWYLGGRLGFLVAKDNQDGFVESDTTVNADQSTRLGRVSIGADVAYLWDAFEPFVNAAYQYDYSRDLVTSTHPDDADDFSLTGGLRWYGDSLTAAFEYNTIIGREDFDSSSYMFSIRGDF